MKTRRLFKEDVYMKEASAVITSAAAEKGKTLVTLDQTIFFPTGGGQKLVVVDKTALATVLGGVAMFAMMTLTKKEKFAKLREWNLTIAMLVAVVITALI